MFLWKKSIYRVRHQGENAFNQQAVELRRSTTKRNTAHS
jgi:hypothetical protein